MFNFLRNSKTLMIGAYALGLSALAVGCGGGGGGGGGGSYDPYYGAWYDVYGVYCHSGYPEPGCNFFSNGVKADYWDDPQVAPLEYGAWEYYDSYGFYRVYSGWARLTANGLLYDEDGYALNEQGQEEGRDLLADVATQEKAKIDEAGKGLAQEHALSEVTGIKIATTLNDWATLGKKHGRTERDIADFSQRLFGVTLAQAKPALAAAQQGDMSALTSLNNDVATHWNTDPETSKEILTGWYSDAIRAAQSARQ